MARVARPAGQRGRTIPAPVRPVRPPRVTLDSPRSSSERGHWVSAHVTEAPGVRGESGQVRRTAAIIAAGALVFLADVRATTPRRIAGDGREGRSGEGVADRGRRHDRRLAGGAPRDRGLGRQARRRHGRRRRRRKVDGAVAPDPQQQGSAVWTPQDKLAYGTKYTLTATAKNTADDETKASSTFTTVTPTSLSTPSIGPLGRHDRRRRHADPRLLRRSGRRQGSGGEPPEGDDVHPDRRRWSWMNDSEVHFRPSQYWPANTHVTLDANLYGVNFGTASGARRTARCPSTSAPSTSPSPMPARTPSRSTTATRSHRPFR